MTSTRVTAIDRSVEKTYKWLDQLADDLGEPGDRHYAYQVLRSVLHTLRDRVPVEVAAHLGAQLSPLLRGIYYDNWQPAAAPRTYRHAAEFLDQVALEASLSGPTQAAFAVDATARVMRRHITPGELAHIRAALPADLAELFDGAPLA